MPIELKIPSPGESITEVEIAQWLVKDGDYVEKDQAVCEIESDKATLELNATESGQIKILVQPHDRVAVGSVACSIDTNVKGEAKPAPEKKVSTASETKMPESAKQTAPGSLESRTVTTAASQAKASPVAKEILRQIGIPADKIKGSGNGGKITKSDVVAYMTAGIKTDAVAGWGGSRSEDRKKMTMLRRKIAERLVAVKNQTAMLTTFNEVDMSKVIALRNKYKDVFKEKHGVSLGFMSLFTKAVTEALRLFPAVNSMIDKDEVISYDYADVGVAVSTPKGLMVPVLRNAERLSLAQIETKIKELALKARDGKLTIDDMTGGTFTITNGGVFGSMLSTPIINPPQSAILGMHNIVERPIALNGKVEIRPVMFVALSYDHRIVDGRESVGFLVKVKEMIENPVRMIFGGKEPEEVLLNL